MRALLTHRSLWLFAAVYALSLAALAAHGIGLEQMVGVLLVFGLALPAAGLAACRGLPPPGQPAPPARGEWWLLLLLLGGVTVFLAVKGPLLAALLPDRADPRLHDAVNMALKLAAFVALPAAVLRLWHGRWPSAGAVTAGRARLWLVFALIGAAATAVQFAFGNSARQLLTPEVLARHWICGALLCFLWYSLEAGLVEEFFFRWLLQNRIAALCGSQIPGVFLGALAFGIAHMPGFWLRGAGIEEGLGEHPALLTALAYSIAMQGVVGLLLATLWARTRSFTLVVALHGLVDAAASTAAFMDTWKL